MLGSPDIYASREVLLFMEGAVPTFNRFDASSKFDARLLAEETLRLPCTRLLNCLRNRRVGAVGRCSCAIFLAFPRKPMLVLDADFHVLRVLEEDVSLFIGEEDYFVSFPDAQNSGQLPD